MKNSIILFVVMISISCSNSNKVTDVFQGNCLAPATKVTLSELKNNSVKFNGKYIDVIGYYKSGFETSAIFKNSRSTNNENALWLRFANTHMRNIKTQKDFTEPDENKKIDGKKIRVIGLFNNVNKGHLDQYFGAVEQICYIEIFN
jgi:ribosomal protein S16